MATFDKITKILRKFKNQVRKHYKRNASVAKKHVVKALNKVRGRDVPILEIGQPANANHEPLPDWLQQWVDNYNPSRSPTATSVAGMINPATASEDQDRDSYIVLPRDTASFDAYRHKKRDVRFSAETTLSTPGRFCELGGSGDHDGLRYPGGGAEEPSRREMLRNIQGE